MLRVTVENSRGKQLELTDGFQIVNVAGLNPPPASISLSDNISDGAEFVHERVEKRNIVIDLVLYGDVEANRLLLYQYVQSGEYIKLYLTTFTKSVWIEGRVESIEVDNWQMNTTCQISVLCPDPWLKNVEQSIKDMSVLVRNFYFPFFTVEPIPFSTYSQIVVMNLINEGNVESGMTIELFARGEVINPIIYNRETREYIGIGSEEKPFRMVQGDTIIVTSQMNNKRVKLIRNAVESNIFNYLVKGSTFLTLKSGDNTFTYSTDDGSNNLQITFKYYSNYEGI